MKNLSSMLSLLIVCNLALTCLSFGLGSRHCLVAVPKKAPAGGSASMQRPFLLDPPRPVSSTALHEKQKRGVGSSGYKRDRLDRLAELETDRVETDKSFVIKAAGAFVGLILVLLVAAFASGLFYDVL